MSSIVERGLLVVLQSSRVVDRSIALLTLVVALMLGSGPSAADWQAIGQNMGELRGIAEDPSSSDRLYAVSAQKLYKSQDAGATWSEVAVSLGCALSSSWARLAGPLQVSSDGQLFLHCYDGAFSRSRDGGLTWEAFGPVNYQHGFGAELFFTPGRPARILILGSGATALTEDGGVTWRKTEPGPEAAIPAWAAVNPQQPGRMFGVGNQNGVTCNGFDCWKTIAVVLYDSHDGGASWAIAGSVLPPNVPKLGGQAFGFAIDSAGRLFVPNSLGLSRSEDSGAKWHWLVGFPTFASPTVPRIAADISTDGHMVAVVGSQLFQSLDAGVGWVAMPELPAPPTAIYFSPGGDLWVTTTGGLYRYDASNDNGITPQTGIWAIDAENNGQPGRGFQVETRKGTLVFTYFGYSTDGHGHWYLSAGTLGGGSFSGRMMQYQGGTAVGATFSPAVVNGSAGTVTLSFSSPTTGAINLPGEYVKSISKFAFRGSGSSAIVPANGLWVIDAENNGQSGRGFQIEQNAGVLVLTYYGYDAAGQETWYLASGAMSGNSFTAALTEYGGGTVLGKIFSSAKEIGSPGQVTLSFTSSTTGTIILPGEATKTISKYSW
jgi:hypothetical protein